MHNKNLLEKNMKNQDIRESGWRYTGGVLRDVLKDLAPYLEQTDCQHFKNLLYIAEQDLSIAHCLQKNHVMHAAGLGYDYSSTVGCYSAYNFKDTISLNGQILIGNKEWLTNLFDSDVVILQALNTAGERLHVVIELGKTSHIISHDHPKSIGMVGAAPGKLIFSNPVTLNQTQILNKAGTQESFNISNYSSYAFITNHLGLIIGLYNDLITYEILTDPSLRNQRRTLELEISTLKILWEDNLPSISITNSSDEFWHRRNTQYAQSKKILLELIHFVLEIGIHNFVDPSSLHSTRFNDALTFVTHMLPLYKCNKDLHYTKF